MALLPIDALQSADRGYAKLSADLSSEAIVDFCMTRQRRFGASRRVREDRMAATFSVKSAPMSVEVVQQFMPLHFGADLRERITG